jgi:hypothetical protein
VIHITGRHGHVVDPAADACDDSRTRPVAVVLNHSSCELAPDGKMFVGNDTYDEVPLNDAAVSEPGDVPNTPGEAPNATVLYDAVPPWTWFTA